MFSNTQNANPGNPRITTGRPTRSVTVIKTAGTSQPLGERLNLKPHRIGKLEDPEGHIHTSPEERRRWSGPQTPAMQSVDSNLYGC